MNLMNFQIILCDSIYIKFQKEEAELICDFRSQHIWYNSYPWQAGYLEENTGDFRSCGNAVFLCVGAGYAEMFPL